MANVPVSNPLANTLRDPAEISQELLDMYLRSAGEVMEMSEHFLQEAQPALEGRAREIAAHLVDRSARGRAELARVLEELRRE